MKRKPQPFPWKPFSKKQKRILHWWRPGSPYADKKILIADGSIRAGKTVCMILSFVLWSMSEFRDKDFIIAGRSVGALKRNVLTPMFQILEGMGLEEGRDYKFHRAEGRIDIGSNRYHLFGANNEKSQDVLQGMTAAGAYADEAALFPRSFIEQMMGRCSVPGAKIWMNCNPKGPYHFIKTEFIDQIDNPKKSVCRIHFLLEDNPALTKETIDFYKGQFSGVFYKRNILGLWVMAEGVIYDMWDESKHTFTELPEGEYSWQVWCDYGTQNPCVFLLAAKNLRTGVYYVVDEYYWSGREKGRQKTDAQYRKDLVEFVGDKQIDRVVIDPSAASFITELRQHTGFPIAKADNDVENGIRVVAKALHQGRLFVHKKCRNTIKEFSSYVWDEKKQEKGKDEPLKENDHAMDAIRYGLNTQQMSNVRFIDSEEQRVLDREQAKWERLFGDEDDY
jgi:PBSX family phage terminase large subunit